MSDNLIVYRFFKIRSGISNLCGCLGHKCKYSNTVIRGYDLTADWFTSEQIVHFLHQVMIEILLLVEGMVRLLCSRTKEAVKDMLQSTIKIVITCSYWVNISRLHSVL